MPLPSPQADESEDQWMNRCMSDETMLEEFPDNDQRVAVCSQKWKDKNALAEDKERRFMPSELRTEETEGKKKKLIGYAAVFNRWSEDFGFFREKIAKGAFARALAEKQDVRALIEHEGGIGGMIGRTASGTLQLVEDDIGLHVEIDLPDTQAAHDVWELVSRRDLSQMSFAFRTKKEQWEDLEDGRAERTLLDVDLYDVSVVTYPAYPDTTVATRNLKDRRMQMLPLPIVGSALPGLLRARLRIAC